MIHGFSSHRGALNKTACVNGGTTLKLSEGSKSPLLEAHPGSPVDITGRRPSLAAAMATSPRYQSGVKVQSPQREGEDKQEDVIMTDGVVAEGDCPKTRTEKRKTQFASSQPFYIPAKVLEQDEVHDITLSVDERLSMDTMLETTSMDFNFEEQNGLWISATPIGHESRTSFATSTTVTSHIADDRFCHAPLTIDTSVASSAASMFSSVGSIQSATTTNSSDIYGWEEELDKKASVELSNPWCNREPPRRMLPSGGRTHMGPRMHNNVPIYRRNDGKRKSLLHRVLNISGSGSRREIDEMGPIAPAVTSA